MYRCYIDESEWSDNEVSLSPEEGHHLVNVLRAAKGDRVLLFDGEGRQATAEIVQIDPLVLSVVDRQDDVIGKRQEIVLIQAIPKGKRMDLIVEKATELGVCRIIPVMTERVVARLDQEKSEGRVERWQRVALSAAKQCGTSIVPKVDNIRSFREIIQICPSFDLLLVGSLDSDAPLLRVILRERLLSKPGTVAVIIGPEGDLTRAEHISAVEAGAIPVSFGDLVLRVETAALFAMSAIRYESEGLESTE